jgi:hypothetical protein
MMMAVRLETIISPIRFGREAETRSIEAQLLHETVAAPWLNNLISNFSIYADLAN